VVDNQGLERGRLAVDNTLCERLQYSGACAISGCWGVQGHVKEQQRVRMGGY